MMLEVIRAGAQTTVQDAGRVGYLSRGIPPSGGADPYSLRLGQALVDRQPGAPLLSHGEPGVAVLEILLMGPKVRFGRRAVFALTGAPVHAKLNGRDVPMWTNMIADVDDELDIGVVTRGAYAYLLVDGGIDVPPWLGSRSTFLRSSQGGFHGRPLRNGDVVPLRPSRHDLGDLEGRRVQEELVDAVFDEAAVPDVRAVQGPQDYMLTDNSLADFFGSEWTLTPVADRSGCRFAGPKLEFRERPPTVARDAGGGRSNIVDDVIPLGGVQIPGGLEAIVFGVDVLGAGGYAKPVTVISADLPLVAQCRPGRSIRFRAVEVEEAHQAGLAQIQAVEDPASIV